MSTHGAMGRQIDPLWWTNSEFATQTFNIELSTNVANQNMKDKMLSLFQNLPLRQYSVVCFFLLRGGDILGRVHLFIFFRDLSF